MPSDQGPIVQSAALRGELVKLRRERGMTQEQIARNLEWSPSKLIRIEGGRSTPNKVDLDALLQQYGVTSASQRERLHHLREGARVTPWWDAYQGSIPSAYLAYVGYEAGAAVIRQFQGSVVPGLLQVREYAEELTASSFNADKSDPVVNLRLQRQSELAQRHTRPRQHYVLDEAVIRRHIGIQRDPTIMHNQLMHIIDTTRREERITVQVIPFGTGAHAGLTGPFTLLEFDEALPDILYLDAGRSEIAMISSPDPKVSGYAESFEKLAELALPASESLEFIRSAAEDMS
jgi:transcriptional regulator with XRE-family HTH domain